jgi:predicted RNase H-related nuclease YkuK (DUF458 family)
MKSPTYGEVDFNRIVEIIKQNVEKNENDKYQVFIGTDSQNFDKTKIVVVIAVHRIGKGGFFFYEISRVKRINDIHQKLITETKMSLDCAEKLMSSFEDLYTKTGFDYTKIDFGIHVDAGYNGPTKAIIPEIVAWIKSCGYECSVKPESFASSAIANKISK